MSTGAGRRRVHYCLFQLVRVKSNCLISCEEEVNRAGGPTPADDIISLLPEVDAEGYDPKTVTRFDWQFLFYPVTLKALNMRGHSPFAPASLPLYQKAGKPPETVQRQN